MISRKTLWTGVMVTFVAGAQTVQAGPMLDYEIDSTHSSVVFKVFHRGVSYIFGRFNELSGTVSIDDREKPTKVQIKASIAAKSVDTNDQKRDKHLKSEDFFSVKEHKEITFESTEVKKIEEKKFELTGNLTLLGQTRSITIPFEITGTKQQGPGKYVLGGHSTFTIKRSEFGMNSALDGVSDEVTIMVGVEAVRDVPPAG